MSLVVHLAEDLAARAGPILAEAIADAIQRRGRCRLALSGGSTPGPTLRWLGEHLPQATYAALWVTWIDERMTHEPADRNDALSQRAWLDAAPALGGRLPMTHTGDLAGDAARYGEAFQADFGGLDVVLLGVGPDGHLASLFPGHPALAATGVCVAVPDSPKPPPARLSLTLPVLERVDCAVLLARGGDKADVLARAQRGDRDLPLGRYEPTGAYHWVLDPTAGARLANQGASHG